MFRPHAPTTELNIVSTTQMKNDIIVEIIRERRGVPVDKESTWGHPHPAWSKDNIKLILCTPVEHSVVTTDSWRNHQPFASSSHPLFPSSLVSLPPSHPPLSSISLYTAISAYFHLQHTFSLYPCSDIICYLGHAHYVKFISWRRLMRLKCS